MKLGPIEISLLGNRKIDREIFNCDVETYNNELNDYILSLTSKEVSKRLSKVIISEFESIGATERIEHCLKKNGIVVVPNFLPVKDCEEISHAIRIKTEPNLKSTSRTPYSSKDMVVQRDNKLVRGFGAMKDHSVPVVNIRTGNDDGMIDIFNVDRLISSHLSKLHSCFAHSLFKRVLPISSGAENFEFCINAYWNRSVVQTRGFHVDSYSSRFKGFIYLTDVLSLGDGPYTYVLESHKDVMIKKANQLLAQCGGISTDTFVLNREKVLPIIARKGTLVISDQSGSHRGWPQRQGGERMLLVRNSHI
jgi:hypothetical protein